MKVLVLTNMYPDKENKSMKGIFVKEQVEYLKASSSINYEVLNLDDGKGTALKKYFFSAWVLARKLKEFSPDIVHVHFGLSFLPMLFCLPFTRSKIVMTLHGSDVLGGSKVVKMVTMIGCLFSDKVISVSPEICKVLTKKMKVPLSKVVVIPCGVALAFFEQSKVLVKQKKVIIFPSDPVRKEKNYDYFDSIIKEVEKEQAVKVEILKGLDRKQVIKLFHSAKLLLLTSDREGSPQVVKEAIASGLPVISRDVGDVRLIAAHTSRLFVVENKADMVRESLSILKSDAKPDENYSEFFDTYSQSSICKRILEVYQS